MDPEFLESFYGENKERLLRIKMRYDPADVFYCPTCIGSDRWVQDEVGRLCCA